MMKKTRKAYFDDNGYDRREAHEKLLLRFALPVMAGNLFQQLYNVVDTAIVGKFVGADALAAVGTTGNVVSFFIMWIIGLYNGAGVIMAQYWGSQLMLGASVCLAVIVLLGRFRLLSLFLNPETDSQAIAYASQYLSIIGIAYMIAGVMNSYLNVIRGAGDVKTSVMAGIAELAGRIFFAFMLSVPAGLGVFGIWLATPLSWSCGCIIPVLSYYKGRWKHIVKTE